MNKKSTNISSSFDSIVYVFSHATKMRLFWSLLKTNDVLSHLPIFIILNYYYYYFEIIWDVQFNCLDDLYYDTWPNVNMSCGIYKMNLIKILILNLKVPR